MTPVARRLSMLDSLFDRPDPVRPTSPAAPKPVTTAPTKTAPTPGTIELSAPASSSSIGKRIDAFYKELSGPYIVDGKRLEVSPAFTSLYGSTNTRPQQEKIRRLLGPAYARLANEVARAVGSRGSPSDIKKTVQALIDAGALPFGKPPAVAIRQLMEDCGIGLDCRGYVFRAFLFSRGTGDKSASGARFNMPDPGNFNFAATQGALKRVSIGTARPGDIIRLKPLGGRDHNVLVRSNRVETLPVGRRASVNGKEIPASFLARSDGKAVNVRVMELDSSWGNRVGVARRVWIQNESSGEWGYWYSSGEFRTSPGPYEHELDGVFRPRSE